MQVSDFDYHLPAELIAQTPAEPRDSSRLLVLERSTGNLEHRTFCDLPNYLRPGDVLVLNDSRVLPARLFGARLPGGGRVEVLLLRRCSESGAHEQWECLVRPGRKIRLGDHLVFGKGQLVAAVVGHTAAGGRIIDLAARDGDTVAAALTALGEMPLPPYIHVPLSDPERYQTVYSRDLGSAAAPTAGLHFTPALLERVSNQGATLVRLTLHIGLGTFRPVQAARVEDHTMHAEYFELSAAAADALNAARQSGGRIIPVGTTALRTLETAAAGDGSFRPQSGWTEIFIYPGYRFRGADALITNFHLPRSTLLMLVAALAGRERILSAYGTAVRQGYRFFSFGDAMLIL